MDENLKTLVILLSGMLVILAAFLLITGNDYPGGFETLGITPGSSYNYEVSLTSSETLYEITMFLPLPSYSGESPVGFAILDGKGYGIPEDMSVDVFGERDSVFLKVVIPETCGLKFGINVPAGEIVETQNPVGGSYVIRPVYDLQSGGNADVYNTYIYASYDASPQAVVKIDVSETGENSWETFSEKRNCFEEQLTLTLTGSQKKWQTAEVSLNKGTGDYSIIF